MFFSKFKSQGKVVEEEILKGGEAKTTNNRMEVLSSISVLQYILDNKLEETEDIQITTDSKYLKDGITCRGQFSSNNI